MRTFFGLLLWLIALPTAAQHTYTVFLDQTVNDEVPVEVNFEAPLTQSESFCFPAVVPGTYSIADYGRFIEAVIAYDAEGNSLEISQEGKNCWKLPEGTQRVTYRFEDTFDRRSGVFEPAGTNIEAHDNYVLNGQGFCGYLRGEEKKPFTLKIKKSASLFGATSLQKTQSSATEDVYSVPSYHCLVDSPILYAKPDTATLQVGNARVLVAVYSESKKERADFIAESIAETLEAQRQYLGGTLPVKHYSFLFYLFSGNSFSGSYGALEHDYSSFYYMPEMVPAFLRQSIVDIAAHEFFHILTPLNLHSKEIENFDYQAPEMSKHLWLYEGAVEYLAQHVLLQQKKITLNEFLKRTREKFRNARSFNGRLPFTELSTECLTKHKSQYPNVYEKGALISLCLDIRLRELSDGKQGLMDVLHTLLERYGKHKPFEDDSLFDEITELTHPEIRAFFTRFVEGEEPLPLDEYLNKVGLDYVPSLETKQVLTGNPRLEVKNKAVRVQSTWTLDATGRKLKYKEGDVLLTVQGEKVTPENYEAMFERLKNELSPGDKIRVEVRRGEKKKRLKAKVLQEEVTERHAFIPLPKPTPIQLRLQQAWAFWKF